MSVAELEGLYRPEPKPITLNARESAVAALDLSVRCDGPEEVCSLLMPAVIEFLERARTADVPIIFTAGFGAKGTSKGAVARSLLPRETEPVIYPDGFDKFTGGELQTWLHERRVKHLIITGSSTHICVLYTATTAARIYRYNVVIPLDGVNATGQLEHEYALHQFTKLPAIPPVQFTKFGLIGFS